MPRPTIALDAGRLTIRAATWSLVQARADRPAMRFSDADGAAWADLLPMACADTLEGPDEWLAVEAPVVEEAGSDADAGPDVDRGAEPSITVRWAVRSTRWSSASLVLRATHTRLAFRLEVAGSGRLTDVRLLGGRGSAWPRIGTGRFWSGRQFDVLVPGGPGDPSRVTQPAGEAAATGMVAGAHPGRARWFFTPGPLAFAASRGASAPWLGIGVVVDDVTEATFTQVAWEADDNGWDVRLDYEGHTRVEERWASPWVELVPGMADPYAALAAPGSPSAASSTTATPLLPVDAGPARVAPVGARRAAEGKTLAEPEARQPDVSWWLEPMFCGWGAQVAEAVELNESPGDLATQDRYDRWLDRLESHGAIPGTIVLDDRWQRTYGRNEPDEARWPDLAGWIEARHARGQRVLLWWKAWDPDGLPEDWTIRDGLGRSIAADPTHPAYAAALADDVGRLLGRRAGGGLGADGLKIDFTGAGPSGASLRTYAERAEGEAVHPWGLALLHGLLAIVARAARAE